MDFFGLMFILRFLPEELLTWASNPSILRPASLTLRSQGIELPGHVTCPQVVFEHFTLSPQVQAEGKEVSAPVPFKGRRKKKEKAQNIP